MVTSMYSTDLMYYSLCNLKLLLCVKYFSVFFITCSLVCGYKYVSRFLYVVILKVRASVIKKINKKNHKDENMIYTNQEMFWHLLIHCEGFYIYKKKKLSKSEVESARTMPNEICCRKCFVYT